MCRIETSIGRQLKTGRSHEATLPFMAAKTVKEYGHDVVLWLWNESRYLSHRKSCSPQYRRVWVFVMEGIQRYQPLIGRRHNDYVD